VADSGPYLLSQAKDSPSLILNLYGRDFWMQVVRTNLADWSCWS